MAGLTIGAFLFEFHLFAVILQLLVILFIEGVRAFLVDDDTWLVLLLYDGLRRCHQLSLVVQTGRDTLLVKTGLLCVRKLILSDNFLNQCQH